MMNTNLVKALIVLHHGTRWQFAKLAGVDEAVVSRVLTGRKPLPPVQREKWAKLLKTTEDVFLEEA
jgi:hypothetical protein